MQLLHNYPGNLPQVLSNILYFGARIGCTGFKENTYMLSQNLQSAQLAPATMTDKLAADIRLCRVTIIGLKPPIPFISSPLGFAPKHDGGLRRIHHLSHPRKTSVNAHIDAEASTMKYTCIKDILKLVVAAGRHCTIVKRDIKDAFRTIPVAPEDRWMLGFQWQGVYYMENFLPFGLSTAPFIFNLFAEAIHWMLQSYSIYWQRSEHYLDDFIAVVPLDTNLQAMSNEYIRLTDALGIPRNESKDEAGTKVTVLGLEVDTDKFVLRVPKDKVLRAAATTSAALKHNSMSMLEVQSLAGFLSFCAPAVQLGWVFMRRIWDFAAQFPLNSEVHLCRRIPSRVRKDLHWWSTLLPQFNGVHFFDTANRSCAYLYTDASGAGLGGFYHTGDSGRHGDGHLAEYDDIAQSNSFSSQLRLEQAQPEAKFDINIHELDAILFGLQKWAPRWQSYCLTVYTDNTTAKTGLWRQTLHSGAANDTLREILLLAAQYDIKLDPHWIPGKTNCLADALSRWDMTTIANLCPHWQTSN